MVRGGRGCNNSRNIWFQIFPNISWGERVIKHLVFPKIIIVYIVLGGGGVNEIMDFSAIWSHFCLVRSIWVCCKKESFHLNDFQLSWWFFNSYSGRWPCNIWHFQNILCIFVNQFQVFKKIRHPTCPPPFLQSDPYPNPLNSSNYWIVRRDVDLYLQSKLNVSLLPPLPMFLYI